MQKESKEYIKYNPAIKRFEAYDSTGQIFGRFFTKEAAEIALKRYGNWLERENIVNK